MAASKNTPREASIVRAILEYLNSLPGCYAEKTWGGPYGNAGRPDIDGCINGRALKLEVKRPGGRLTKLQAERLARWRAAGAVAEVVCSVDDVKRLIERRRKTG